MLGTQLSAGGMQDSSLQGGVELRAAARTNLFMAATLKSANIGHSVKIRDLSATGARIETFLALEVGAAVTLIRGGLSVQARVGWHAERFCGLSFESPVSIQAWMANPLNLERQRRPPRVAVDGEVMAPVHREAESAESLADELTRVSRWLEAFGQTLANDPQVVFKHGTQLFSLGLAARTLAALAETMEANAPRALRASAGADNDAPANHSARMARRAKLASQCSPM